MAIVSILVTVLALLLSSSAGAQIADPVISTGREGGSYFYIGERLKSSMLLAHGTYFGISTSQGSIENLTRLHDAADPVGVTLTQADALAWYLGKHPEFEGEYMVLGDVGKECLFLFAGHDGPLATGADLKKDTQPQISVDDATSGAAVTFAYMQQLNPAFGATKVVYADAMQTLLQLKIAAPNTPTLGALIVQRPNTDSAPVKTFFQNPDLYSMVSFTEADVGNAKLPDGSVVYTFERVIVGGKKRARAISADTMCTRGLLLASQKKLSKEQLGRLSEVMLESGEEIVGEDE